MHRVALFVLAWVVSAQLSHAHNGPPTAYAVLAHDAAGPLAVSFSAGVALRRAAQRYQFVCPAAWVEQFTSPVAALADGTLVVGAAGGLMLLDSDGTPRPHPDPAAVGRSTELVRGSLGVFALRPALTGSEVVAIDGQTVRVLWQDTTSWASLAALGDKLVLARGGNRSVDLITLSALDGAIVERQSAVVDLPVDYVFARASTSAAYVLLVYRSGTLALGSLVMNMFTQLADAQLSLAGPLSIDATTLLALDGALQQLNDGALLPLADDHSVVGLGEQDGLAYACEREGISRLSGPVLAEPLFRFSWLEPPALELVEEGEARMLCNAQWQDFLLDMQLAMLDPSVSSAPPMTVQTTMAGAGSVQLPAAEPTPQRAGCTTLPGAAPDLYWLPLVLVVVWCQRRRV
jgi:hypothetical protein